MLLFCDLFFFTHDTQGRFSLLFDIRHSRLAESTTPQRQHQQQCLIQKALEPSWHTRAHASTDANLVTGNRKSFGNASFGTGMYGI